MVLLSTGGSGEDHAACRSFHPGIRSWFRIPGHVLPALAKATVVEPRAERIANQPVTLTIVLKRDDQAGFEKYLKEITTHIRKISTAF